MKKNKLLIIILMFLCFLKIDIVKAEIVYEEYKVGDIITYNGMEFYVIEYSGVDQDYVTLLKDIPLTTEEMTDLVSSTEIFDAIGSDNGYLTVPYIFKDNCVSGGDVSGCSTDYSISSIKQVIDVWANAKLKDTDLKEDKLGYKTRLITYEELYNNLGYSKATWNVSYWKVNPEYTPSWVYNSNYSYYTMTPEEDFDTVIYQIYRMVI